MSNFACFKKNDGGNKLVFISIPSTDLLMNGGLIYQETGKAFGLDFHKGEMCWLPKSQVKEIIKNFDDLSIEFWIPTWLLEKKQLEKYKSTAYEPSLF